VLVEYLKNSLVADTSELWLFCDGWPGWNKNCILFQLTYTLVHVLITLNVVMHAYPVQGHSYLPCVADTWECIGQKQ
jgi:hypothetical protein